MKFFVAYRVQGTPESLAGPYETHAEAHTHAEDIRGYERVEYAVVLDEDFLQTRKEQR